MLNENSMKYNIYLSTNPGKVRKVNEDNFVINKTIKNNDKPTQHIKGNEIDEPLLCGVFDGMGGEKGGFEASYISAVVACEYFDYLVKSNKPAEESISSYVANCNQLIRKFLSENKLNRGGSTFALAYLNNSEIHLFSMGDTRIYLFRSGNFIRISRDHTLANKKYEANIFTKEEAEASPESHMLTLFLGMNNDNNNAGAEVYNPVTLNKNDKLLICSDGLYDMCSDKEIADILSVPNQPYTIQLVNAALDKGGIDNITCMVIEATE